MILKKALVFPILFMITVTGCSNSDTAPEHNAHHAPNGDLRETTASIEVLPSFLDGQQQMIRNAYLIAGQSTDVLEWIPCYCGCGESAGHQNNKNCFIHEIKEDGTVVWDDHGTRCGVCIQTAVESAVMKKNGLPLKEIREAIDEKYQEGYGPPTPTLYP